jgi:hypothetical protein
VDKHSSHNTTSQEVKTNLTMHAEVEAHVCGSLGWRWQILPLAGDTSVARQREFWIPRNDNSHPSTLGKQETYCYNCHIYAHSIIALPSLLKQDTIDRFPTNGRHFSPDMVYLFPKRRGGTASRKIGTGVRFAKIRRARLVVLGKE